MGIWISAFFFNIVIFSLTWPQVKNILSGIYHSKQTRLLHKVKWLEYCVTYSISPRFIKRTLGDLALKIRLVWIMMHALNLKYFKALIRMIRLFPSLTCSCCCTWPNCLFNVWRINFLAPHAYFTSDDQLLLFCVIYTFQGFVHVKSFPWGIQVIQVPLILIAYYASKPCSNNFWCYIFSKPVNSWANLPAVNYW